MSDLEDLDHEPDDARIEEELAAPPERPSGPGAPAPADGFSALLGAANKGVLLKAAAALVVVIGVGAFFMTSHHARKQTGTAFSLPPSTHDAAGRVMQKDDRQAGGDAWNAPPPVPAAAPSAPSAAASAAGTKPHELLPSAIPPLDQGAAIAAPAAPPIVNDLPPSSAQLASASNAVPPSPPATPPSAPPSALNSAANMPGMPAAPSMPFPPSSAVPAQMPPGFTAGPMDSMPPAPVNAPANATSAVKNGEPMPSALVPAVDKADLNKMAPNNNAMNNESPALPAAPAPAAVTDAQAAKVEELQKKIEDLEKTISQLQQAAVVKEETAEKPAAPRVASSHHKSSQRHVQHAAAVKWTLKAAKPGVAWLAKKGSDDLQMVEVGDFLTGVGTVTEITRNEAGIWVVKGTKGRISQQ